MAHLEENRKNFARLADPRGLSEQQAQELLAKTKPIYTLSCGLHSAELGPPEMLMELAYWLVTEDFPLIEKIRSKLVVAIMPVADPDGRDRSIDWYNRYLIDVTDDDANFEGGVPYWGKYTNTTIIGTSITPISPIRISEVVSGVASPPSCMISMSRSGFLIAIAVNPRKIRLLIRSYGRNFLGFPTLRWAQLTKYGMPGVWTHGYVAIMSANQNGMMRMYEIMGDGGGTTMHRFITPANPALSSGPAPVARYELGRWRRLPPWLSTVSVAAFGGFGRTV